MTRSLSSPVLSHVVAVELIGFMNWALKVHICIHSVGAIMRVWTHARDLFYVSGPVDIGRRVVGGNRLPARRLLTAAVLPIDYIQLSLYSCSFKKVSRDIRKGSRSEVSG